MKIISTVLMSACMALAAGSVSAADAKKDAMAKDGAMVHPTTQQCQDHKAMAKKDGMKKDDAMMKMEAACAEMMKGDHAKSGDHTMKKDGKAADPMKK